MLLTSFKHFLSMGGYAAYVWAAYAFTFLILIALLRHAFKEQRDILKQLRQ